MARPPPIKLCDDFLSKMEEQVKREFVPSVNLRVSGNAMTVHIYDYPLLSGMWALIRESVIVNGKFPRDQKEIMATFVSKSNKCTYCTAAHTHMASAKGADDTVYTAIAKNDASLLSYKRTADLAQWMVDAQEKNSPVLKEKPPFTLEEAPELIGTACQFNYINRVVDTFLTRSEFLPGIPWHKRLAMNVLPFVKGNFVNERKKLLADTESGAPGDFEKLVSSEIVIPEDLKWASSNPAIQKAFAYFRMAVDELANKYIPDAVKEFVGHYVEEKYDGGKPPLYRSWVFDVADGFDGSEAERCAIRFMLLVSFARFQIDKAVMSDMERQFPEDATRKAMGMWAAYQTARKIADWQAKAVVENTTK